MAGVNKVTILGNLGADPEIRIMPNGDHTATLSVATSRYWKDQASGETKELVEWHRIVLYRRLAEVAGDYLHKGSKVYVEGYLKTQKWTDSNGIDRWTTSIVGEELLLLDSKPKENEPVQSAHHTENTGKGKKAKSKNAPQTELPIDDFDGTIPF